MVDDSRFTSLTSKRPASDAARAVLPADPSDVVEWDDTTVDDLPTPVNYRLLVATALGIALIGGGVVGLHKYQIGRIAGEFRELSLRAREAGDSDAAIEHLRRYLAIAPNDADAIEDLAFSIADQAETTHAYFRAAQLFERILRDAPETSRVRRKLVDIYMALGRSDAIAHLDQLLVSDPVNAELLTLRAQCLEHSGRYQDARKDYAVAVDLAPQDVPLLMGFVRLLSGPLKKPDEALSKLNQLVQRNPNDADAYLARSQFHWEQGRVREARIDAVRAYRLEPDNEDVLVFLVTLGSFSDWPTQPLSADQLRDKLQQVSSTDEPGSGPDLALVDLAIITGDYADAERRLKSILEVKPDWDTALQVYADVLSLMGKHAEADELFTKIDEHGTGRSSLATFMRARSAFRRGEWPKAASLFRQIVNDSTAAPFVRTNAGLNLAACCREMGQPTREQQACLDVLNINPRSNEATLQLAESWRRTGDLDEAREQFERLPDNPEAAVAVAQIMIEQNRRLPESQQRWERVEAAVTAASILQQDPATAVLLRSQMLIAQHREAEAVEVLERALRENTGHAGLWLQLFEAEFARQNVEACTATLQQAEAVLKRPEFTLPAWIRLASFQQDRDALARHAESITTLAGSDAADERDNLYQSLALAWQSIGELEKARDCWTAIRSHRPYDISVLQRLLTLSLIEGDDDRASALIQEIRDIDGTSGIQWRLAELTRLLALVDRGERSHLDTAAEMLKELDQEMPPSAVISTLRGDVARLQGNVEEAMQHYQAAIDLGNPSHACIVQMAGLLFQRGQFAEVSRLIRRFEQNSAEGLSPQLARLGALASLQENSPLEAVRFATLGAEPDAAGYRDLIALGQFQQIAGQHQQAEKSFRRVTELVPERPDGWIALVTFLNASERSDDVKATITRAREAVAPELVDFTLAQCYEVIGDQQQAAACYDRVTANLGEDPRPLRAAIEFHLRCGEPEIAKRILRTILAEEQKSLPAMTAVARRLLAAILADSHQYAAQREALALLDANLNMPEGKPSRQDQLLKARLLADSKLRRERLAARDLLDQLEDESFLPIPLAQQLAELHRDFGEHRSAADVTRALVVRTHRDPEVLNWAIDFVLGLGQTSERLDMADRWIEMLETIRPDELETKILRARNLISHGQTRQAVAMLRTLADAKETLETSETAETTAASDQSWQPKLQLALAIDGIARDLDRNGQVADAEDLAKLAEDLYRQAPPHSEASLLMVRFLIGRWRVDEALEVCDQLRGHVPDDRLALAYVSLLRTRHLSRQKAAEVHTWLRQRSEQSPDSVTLLLCRAHAASLAGDFQDAEALYRRVVELQPENVEALNELALLTALRGESLTDAMKYIEQAIAQAGPLGVLLDTKAIVELANQQPAAAEQSLLAALAESPAAEFYFHLAQARLALGKVAPAKESLRQGFQRGLHVNNVHPLERSTFEHLQAQLGR